MKQRNFLKIALVMLISLLASFNTKAQSLSAGDIAIIAYNADGDDDFAFVTLVDIPANQTIYFTDNEWNGTAFSDLNEGELTWTNASSILSAGTVVVLSDVALGSRSSSVGSISGSGFNLGASNEWFYALTEVPATSYTSTPTFLAAFANDAGSGWLTGTGLSEGSTAIDFNDDNDGYEYTGARTGENSLSDYRAIIYASANWSIETSNGENILPINSSSFTTGAASPNITLGTVSGNTTEAGGTATFTVVLDAEPASDVVLNISSGDTGEVTLDKASLTFTNGNWDQTQIVTATGIDDAIQDGSVDVTITISVNDGSSDDAYDPVADVTTTVTNEDNELPNLVINEFQADPDSTNGDANGDGSVDTAEDEFIEIYNASGGELNIGGYTIEDAVGLRHTFPKGTILPTGGTIIVFGGGTPTNIPSLTQTATAGFLGLNNGGDTINIKDAGGTTVTSHAYGAEGGNNISLARDPDFTGGFVTHDNVTGNGSVLFSPGRDNTDNAGFYNTWSGTTNNVWTTATNWIDSNNPSAASDNVLIPAGLTNYPTAASAVTVNSTYIASGASLKAENTFSGTVHYKRNLGTTNWYLVSSPVSGEIMTDMRANNSFADGTAGSRIGFATYNPGQTGAAAWTYFTTSSTNALTNGTGYSAKLSSSGDLSFTGSLNTTDVVTASLSTGFNLIGNPYTSYVNSATFLGAGTSTNLDQTQIWLWSQATDMYEVKTAGDAWVLAPGQGFFVNATPAGTVTFAESNQDNAGNTFQKVAKTELKLWMNDGEKNRFAKIYYTENGTKGFDYGWEGETFGGISSALSLYSQLLDENQGKKYQLQTLPKTELENMVIPIGIIADAGKTLSFSTETTNLPIDVKVYLEDRQANTFNEISNGNTFEVTLSETSNDVGRFYVHVSRSALSVEDNLELSSVSMYKANASTLKIVGLPNGKSNVKLFTILGKKVLNTSFYANGVKEISLPKLATGVYIVQLETEKGKLNKKITLE